MTNIAKRRNCKATKKSTDDIHNNDVSIDSINSVGGGLGVCDGKVIHNVLGCC